MLCSIWVRLLDPPGGVSTKREGWRRRTIRLSFRDDIVCDIIRYAESCLASLQFWHRASTAEGTSLNQFINVAIAEKLSALEAVSYFERRGAKGDREAFLAILNRPGGEPPALGDDLPD